jgi:hypothetical protein
MIGAHAASSASMSISEKRGFVVTACGTGAARSTAVANQKRSVARAISDSGQPLTQQERSHALRARFSDRVPRGLHRKHV